jgi:hypothetical protein
MRDLESQAQPALEKLLERDERNLYAELGMRLEAIKQDPSISGNFDLDAQGYEAFGVPKVIRDFGQQFFERMSVQAYALVCGSNAEHSQEREKLISAFGIGKEAVAPALAALMVSSLGLAPALAAVLAALVIKLFFKPGHAAMCEVWKARLPQAKECP